VNNVEDMPPNGIGREQMSKELRDDAQSIRFVAMDGVEVLREHFLVQILPESVQFAEALTD